MKSQINLYSSTTKEKLHCRGKQDKSGILSYVPVRDSEIYYSNNEGSLFHYTVDKIEYHVKEDYIGMARCYSYINEVRVFVSSPK